MRRIHDSHVGEERDAADSVIGFVEIQRGGTQYPRRPITSSRFLIGAGTNCHLQLGGDIPLLHTLLTRDSQGWAIEAIAPEPELLVNGGVVCRSRLTADDLVAVGPFQFRLIPSTRRDEPVERAADVSTRSQIG